MGVPKVSVIVTNFNYGRYLYECVASIRNQTFKDYELIIVDYASNDGSSSLVRHLADKAVTFSKNQGTRVASNTGVNVASGTYCCFINADDKVEPTFLSECVKTLDSDPSLSLTYTDFWHFGQTGDKTIDNGVILHEWDINRLKEFNYILCSALFKREVFHQVGGFEVDYGMEDYDLWLRMGLNGHKGKRTPGYLYHYRAHNSNRTHRVDVQSAIAHIKAKNNTEKVSAYESSDEPIFSICYATRRSWCIKAVVEDWLQKAKNRKAVEFVIGVDANDMASVHEAQELSRHLVNTFVVIQNHEPFNAVKAWNAAAKATKGKVLIVISDDFVPPQNWDSDLIAIKSNWINERWVVRVNDCNNSAQNKPITLPIITRARYEELGYVYWPEYESTFCDTDLTEHAKLDNIVLDARTLLFEHIHPTCLKRKSDSVDSVHSSHERWLSGKSLYESRLANGFKANKAKPHKSIDIISSWKAYTLSVKNPIFSVSLEGCLWLEDMLKKTPPGKALEIGSNYVSAVLKSCGFDTTIADDPEAANGTYNFLQRLGLDVKVCDIKSLGQQGPEFDVVFVNAYSADSKERHDLITTIAPKLVKEGGMLILNDGHFVNVRKAMDYIMARGWTCDVPRQTIDKYDRYWMVLKRVA